MSRTVQNDSERLRRLVAEQQAQLLPGVHYHPLPPPQVGATHHGLVGTESALNSRILRRPHTSDGSGSHRTQVLSPNAASSPRTAMQDLRTKGIQEEALRAAAEGARDHKQLFVAASATPQRRDADEISRAAYNITAPPSFRPASAAVVSSSSARGRLTVEPLVVQMTPKPPQQQQQQSLREDLPTPQNLPSATVAASASRSAAQALDNAKCANPFYVAHAPPDLDIASGEPSEASLSHYSAGAASGASSPVAGKKPTGADIVDNLIAGGSATTPAAASAKRPASSSSTTSIAASSSAAATPYRASTALTQSAAAEYHESQREVLNLQLRGVAEHALKMRRQVVESTLEPIKLASAEMLDMCNGCTAALRSYEENYDCVYEIKAPELHKVTEECKLKTPFGELQRLLELPVVDSNNLRAALAELSAPVDEDPTEDALKVLSQSRLDLARRTIGRLDGLAGLSVADSILRMYEILHTDVISAPRELLAADETSLNLMQRDVETLYVKRTTLLDEVQHSTNRTLPLMADGPLSAAGALSTTSAASAGVYSAGASASREISALLAASGEQDATEVTRQLMQEKSAAGRPIRVHTVEALSAPRQMRAATGEGDAAGSACPVDTEDDTDGRKLSVAESTQRREVNVSREILNRRTHRCNAMLDFVDGVRAFVADAVESHALGKEITTKNLQFAQRTLENASVDLDTVATVTRDTKQADQAAQTQHAEEQREAHQRLAALAQQEGSLWAQIQKLVEQAHEVSTQRDDLLLARMRETELEARRQKFVRLQLERLNQLSTQLTRAKRSIAKYEAAAKDADAFHTHFVAEAIGAKLRQEDELITMRGAEALAFAQAFRTFVFSAEDLLSRLEVRDHALRQRQRSAAMDESVAQESLDVAGRDSYLAEMRRLGHMVEETDKRRAEVSAWLAEGRASARTFLPIAVAAREAASRSQRPASSSAAQKAAKLAGQLQDDKNFESAEDARLEALKQIDLAENIFSKQKQTAEEQVEELRTDIRKQRKEAQAQIKASNFTPSPVPSSSPRG